MEEKVKEKQENAGRQEAKPTYEELKMYCNQLLMQRNQVAERLDEITDIVNKLPWLFEVIKNASSFNEDFVYQCIDEIEHILTPPKAQGDKEEPEKESKEDNKE